MTTIQLLMTLGIRLFLVAWLVDIVYDKFAPETWEHFGYWEAVLGVLLFNVVIGTVFAAVRNAFK